MIAPLLGDRRALVVAPVIALLLAIGIGLSIVRLDAGITPERQVLDLVRMRAPGREPIVVVAPEPSMYGAIASRAKGHPQIAVRRERPAPSDAQAQRAFALGRVFLLELAGTPALASTRADVAARGWGLTSGMAFDAAPRERIAVLQVSSPPVAEPLWVPPGATQVERHVWIDGTFGVSFELAVGPQQDVVTSALRARLASHGWSPRSWEHLNPLTPTSVTAGWRIAPRGIVPDGYDPARDGPLPVWGEWLGEWRDAAGNQVAYRLAGDGRQGRGSAAYLPAAVVAEMTARLDADRRQQWPYRDNVSRDGAPARFDSEGVVVIADAAALAALRDDLLPLTGGFWGLLADRLRAAAAPHRVAVGDVAGHDGGTFQFGGDDLEAVPAGDAGPGVVDVSSGVLLVAALGCVPKLADVLTPERLQQVLDAPAGGDRGARRLQHDVGRSCFALVRAAPGRRFAANEVYRLRPGAPARVAPVRAPAGPAPAGRRF
jgi:hypothetical protein